MVTASAEEDALLAGALWIGNEVVLSGSLGTFDDLASSVAGEANHSTSGKKQKFLDGLYEKIDSLLS